MPEVAVQGEAGMQHEGRFQMTAPVFTAADVREGYAGEGAAAGR